MSVYSSCIVLKGPEQQAVAAYLRQEGRDAVVAPTVNGCTALADRDCDRSTKAGLALTERFSSLLECAAIFFHNHSDDVLYYYLYDRGRAVDAYNSVPDYFDFRGEHHPPRGPQGGDAAVLCAVFGRPGQEERVEAILRRRLRAELDEEFEEVGQAFDALKAGGQGGGGKLFEAMQRFQERVRSGSIPAELLEDCERRRHLELLNALGLPTFCVGLVYADAFQHPTTALECHPGIPLSPDVPEDAALLEERVLTENDPSALVWVGTEPHPPPLSTGGEG